MNQQELREFFEKYEVPFMETGAGLAMEGWGKLPRHLQEKLKHEQRTGGKNRAQRRGGRAKDRVRGQVRT